MVRCDWFLNKAEGEGSSECKINPLPSHESSHCPIYVLLLNLSLAHGNTLQEHVVWADLFMPQVDKFKVSQV